MNLCILHLFLTVFINHVISKFISYDFPYKWYVYYNITYFIIHLGMYILLATTTNSKNYDNCYNRSFVVIKQPADGNDIIVFAS